MNSINNVLINLMSQYTTETATNFLMPPFFTSIIAMSNSCTVPSNKAAPPVTQQ